MGYSNLHPPHVGEPCPPCRPGKMIPHVRKGGCISYAINIECWSGQLGKSVFSGEALVLAGMNGLIGLSNHQIYFQSVSLQYCRQELNLSPGAMWLIFLSLIICNMFIFSLNIFATFILSFTFPHIILS